MAVMYGGFYKQKIQLDTCWVTITEKILVLNNSMKVLDTYTYLQNNNTYNKKKTVLCLLIFQFEAH